MIIEFPDLIIDAIPKVFKGIPAIITASIILFVTIVVGLAKFTSSVSILKQWFGNDQGKKKAFILRRKNSIAARDQQFGRIQVKPNTNIFEHQDLPEDTKNITTAYKSAFQSHAFQANFPRSFAGLRSSGPKKRAGGIAKTNPLERATAKFHGSTNYIASFRLLGYKDPWLNEAPKKNKAPKQIAQRIVDFLQKPILDNDTQMVLVSGEIGCGKSTLLSNVIYKISRFQTEQERQRDKGSLALECVLIDFDNIPMAIDSDPQSYVDSVINPYIAEQIVAQTNLEGQEIKDVLAASKIVNLVLIFDNMDAAYYNFCTELFVNNTDVSEIAHQQKYHPLVLQLINSFQTGQFSQLGLKCIFALRTDTIEALMSYHGPDHGQAGLLMDQDYRIRSSDDTYLTDVIERRLLLARDCCAEKHKKLFEDRLKKFRNSKKDFSSILDVSVQGLRHTINVMSDLSGSVVAEEQFIRYFCSELTLQTYFYVSGKVHYSQVNHGITNIFLVNNRYRRENNISPINGKRLIPESLLEDHPQTYWLKYLILHYIFDVTTEKENVISLFCKTGGYNEKLVRLVLFSLSEVKHGRLIRPNIAFGQNANVGGLGLVTTSRGQRLIERKHFWNFFYLAMIVEDTWLEIPNVYKIDFQNPIGFAYLREIKSNDYNARFTEFLCEKIKTVFLFLSILQESYALESKANKKLFNALKKNGVNLPNFKEIRTSCAEDIEKSVQNLDQTQKSKVLHLLREHQNPIQNCTVRIKTRQSIKKCYPRALTV